jgi:hypothetical protein
MAEEARMSTKDDGKLITRREASELAGVHINTIRLWESTHRVDTVKGDNGVVLIPRSQVEEIVESRRDLNLDDKSKIAALDAELRVTRDELERMRAQYRQLLDRMLDAREHDRVT